MTDTAYELRDKIAGMIRDSLFGGGPPASEFLEDDDKLIEAVRADLARPAPAEGAVREAALREAAALVTRDMDEEPPNSVDVGMLAEWEALRNAADRILSALSTPEDATPAAPVSVGEAATAIDAEARRRYDKKRSPITDPVWDDIPHQARQRERGLVVWDGLRTLAQRGSNTTEGDPQ